MTEEYYKETRRGFDAIIGVLRRQSARCWNWDEEEDDPVLDRNLHRIGQPMKFADWLEYIDTLPVGVVRDTSRTHINTFPAGMGGRCGEKGGGGG